MTTVFSLKKKYFKKRILKIFKKTTLTQLIKFYKNMRIVFHNTFLDSAHLYTSLFFLSSPQRQLCYAFYNLTTKKQINYTSGLFLKLFTNSGKYYKRSFKNIGPITMHLRKLYSGFLKKIFLFKIKNYTVKHHHFWMKLHENFNPRIFYFLHKQSFIPRWQGKRRIKRVILRNLGKI